MWDLHLAFSVNYLLPGTKERDISPCAFCLPAFSTRPCRGLVRAVPDCVL